MPKKHPIKVNDHISKLARQYGFNDWKKLWDANGKLKKKRSNPNILFKTDRSNTSPPEILEIPLPTDKKEKKGTEVHWVFNLVGQKLFLRLRILKDDFKAIQNADYTLKVDGTAAPPEKKGKTDGNGQIEMEIPADAQNGELTVRIKAEDSETEAPAGDDPNSDPNTRRGDVPITWALKIGALNPIQEKAPDKWCISGVQQRLNNLAFNTGPVDGILGSNTRAAVRAFKSLYQVGSKDDKPGDETQSKLFDVHDKPDSVVEPPAD